MELVLAAAWLIGVVYASIPPFWLLIHPFAERWRRSKTDARSILGFTWLGMIVLLAASRLVRLDRVFGGHGT